MIRRLRVVSAVVTQSAGAVLPRGSVTACRAFRVQPSTRSRNPRLGTAKKKKQLGQCLLMDPGVLQRVVQSAKIREGDTVLEIGPGTGNLTTLLLEAPCQRVVAIEKDPDMLAEMHLRFSEEIKSGQLKLIRGDANSVQWPPFDVLVANIPYELSAPLTFKLLRHATAEENGEKKIAWRRAVMMYQKEFAQRLSAVSASTSWSRLAVSAQLRAKTKLLFEVPRHCFRPMPRVHSAVVRFRPRRMFARTPSEEFTSNESTQLQDYDSAEYMHEYLYDMDGGGEFEDPESIDSDDDDEYEEDEIDRLALTEEELDSPEWQAMLRWCFQRKSRTLRSIGTTRGSLDTLHTSDDTHPSKKLVLQALSEVELQDVRPRHMSLVQLVALRDSFHKHGMRFTKEKPLVKSDTELDEPAQANLSMIEMLEREYRDLADQAAKEQRHLARQRQRQKRQQARHSRTVDSSDQLEYSDNQDGDSQHASDESELEDLDVDLIDVEDEYYAKEDAFDAYVRDLDENETEYGIPHAQ
ncbi:MAG: hypothetical protein MHM6MM_003323 [Cercozoa sp. M6MM]